MKIGVDVGYSHTKVWTNNGGSNFKSTIQEGNLDVCNSIHVQYLGKDYTIGENSDTSLYDNNVNKIDSLNFKLCLFTAVAMAMGEDQFVDDDVKIVTGLPASYYNSQKDSLINELKDKSVDIVLNGKPKHFTIKEVIVFPQSAGVLLLEPEKLRGDVCVIDVGGFTVDVAYFNNKKLKKLETFELGMNILGKALVTEIKNEHGIAYDVLRADDLLDSQVIYIKGEPVEIDTLIDKILKQHTGLILNRLESIKEFNVSKRIFIGGGSLRLANNLGQKLDKDTIYTNAKAFYTLGVSKFGKN